MQSLELEGEPTNNRNELLTILAPVRCARVGGLRVRKGKGAQAVVPLVMQVGVRKGWKVVAEWTAQGKWAPEGGGGGSPALRHRYERSQCGECPILEEGSKSCFTAEAEPWKVSVRFPT